MGKQVAYKRAVAHIRKVHHVEVNQSVGIQRLVNQCITHPDSEQLSNLLAAHIPVLIVDSVAQRICLFEYILMIDNYSLRGPLLTASARCVPRKQISKLDSTRIPQGNAYLTIRKGSEVSLIRYR